MPTPIPIAELPADERPRERILSCGSGALSDRELLAVLLSTGPQGEGVLAFSSRILDELGGLRGFGQADARRLLAIRGIGPQRASMLLAGLELGRRSLSFDAPSGMPVRSPRDLEKALIGELGTETREVLGVFLLDLRMRLIGFRRISQGSLAATPASARDLFACAVNTTAAALILAHNHPSGDPTPSAEDLTVTDRMVRAGQALEIPVIDHLILGGRRVISLRESGQLPGD